MIFNNHKNLEGLHAPFSPSQSSWLRYSEDKAIDFYENKKAADMGTRLHAWAKETIDLRIKQAQSKKTLCMYVNDAIYFRMSTEVVLFHSFRFFGTADAISFRYIKGKGFLRIHDLKTGVTPAKMEQLLIYAALFCLEYKVNPEEIDMELRIYQNNDIDFLNDENFPEIRKEVRAIMNHIIMLDSATELSDKEV